MLKYFYNNFYDWSMKDNIKEFSKSKSLKELENM